MILEDRLVFRPALASRRWAEPPTGYEVQEIRLRTADGTPIDARWFPCPGAKGAVLICHGQSGNLSVELGPRGLASWHKDIGVSALIFDYPGYGRSGGTPSEAGCYAAADAAYAWLVSTPQVPPDDIILYGWSLGTGVAVDLASRRPHRALVLVSPYTSLPDVAIRRFGLFPAPWLMRNQFPSVAKIGQCTRPTLIVHGTSDHVVPYALGEALFEAANAPKRFAHVEGGRHGNGVGPEMFVALHEFLGEVELPDR